MPKTTSIFTAPSAELLNSLPLGTRSDLVVNRFGLETRKTDDFVTIRTLGRPNYYFGNLLAINTLSLHSKAEWEQIFDQEFLDIPGTHHKNFTWKHLTHYDSERQQSDLIEEFKSSGYHHDVSDVRMASTSTWNAPTLNAAFTVRPLTSESDWDQWTESHVLHREDGHEEAGYRKFVSGSRATYQRLIEEQSGVQLGAFDAQDRLVSFAGVFYQHRLARCQFVFTDPAFRNKGLCQTVLHHLAQHAFQHADQLVICADETYFATHIYEKLGFKLASRESALCLWAD